MCVLMEKRLTGYGMCKMVEFPASSKNNQATNQTNKKNYPQSQKVTPPAVWIINKRDSKITPAFSKNSQD